MLMTVLLMMIIMIDTGDDVRDREMMIMIFIVIIMKLIRDIIL